MSLTSSNGVRSSLTLAPLTGTEPAEAPLFPVDPELVVGDPPSLQDGIRAAALLWCTHSGWPTVRAIAAGVHDPEELTVLAGGVRSLPAA